MVTVRRVAAFVVGMSALLAGCKLEVRPTGATERPIAYGESIESFDADIEINEAGGLTVRETITYDYGSNSRHGIYRDIPDRFDLVDDPKRERVTPIRIVSVTSPSPDTPAQYTIESPRWGTVRLKIGDPDRLVAGRHTYVITYNVSNVLSEHSGATELYWNVSGDDWNVPINELRAVIDAPAGSKRFTCFQGARGSTSPCAPPTADGTSTVFTATNLAPYAGLTAALAYDDSTFDADAVAPLIVAKPERGFVVDASTVLACIASAIAVATLLFLTLRRGRDRKFTGGEIDAAMGNATGADEVIGLGERVPTPVQFEPPDGIRPGQLGTLIDGVANPLDVTATIIDLATRGYLVITEIPKSGWFGRTDWELTRTEHNDALHEYESLLLRRLFAAGPVITLSSLHRSFAAELAKVQRALYEDLVLRRWFANRPDKVRAKWRAIGCVVLVASIVAIIPVGAASKWLLAMLPLPFLGFGLILGARVMPIRTAKGTALVRRAAGFKHFMESFTETERARFAERTNIFYEYLPYAIVFGCAEHWAEVFAPLALPAPDWYRGHDMLTTVAFLHAIDGFSSRSVSTLSAAAASSSSGGSGFSGGFSGGGFGGGGGGSW